MRLVYFWLRYSDWLKKGYEKYFARNLLIYTATQAFQTMREVTRKQGTKVGMVGVSIYFSELSTTRTHWH